MTTRKVLGKKADDLKNKNVVILGLGGLGCTVANLLARLKINLTLVDDDIVDDTNLERQILYYKNDLLKSKVGSAKEKLSEYASIKTVNERLDGKNISEIIPKNIDLVIDCTDNIATRLAINKYCKENNINWIYSGAVHSIGAIYFVNNKNDGPCFECVNGSKDGETSCEIGVLNTIVTIIASLASNIAINYLVDGKIEDKMLRINMNDNSITKIAVKKNPKCEACSIKFLKVEKRSI